MLLTGWLHTILLSAEYVRLDTAAPSIHTRRSPLHTPAFSAAPPPTRLTEKWPFSPGEQKQENKFVLMSLRWASHLGPWMRLPGVVLPSTGVKLIPRPWTGSLVIWQSLGGLQPSPLCILARPWRFWPCATTCSYTSPSSTNKHSWFPLSFIFRATWFIRRQTVIPY